MYFKRQLSAFLAAAMVLSSANIIFADDTSATPKEPTDKVTDSQTEPAYDNIEGFAADDTAADEIAYPVEGGNIYFDKSTGTITRSDEDIVSANIPNTIDNVTVYSIGSEAFYNRSSLTSVTIPDTVTVIERGAFTLCTSLKSITIPSSVCDIEYYAFAGCSSLTDVNFAKEGSSLRIGSEAFLDCDSLKSIVIPDYVMYIGSAAFGIIIDAEDGETQPYTTIYCSKGSCAEAYARRTVTPFYYTDGSKGTAGMYLNHATSVPANTYVDGVELIYRPCSRIPLNSTVTVELKNGTFDPDIAEKGKYGTLSWTMYSYEDTMKEYLARADGSEEINATNDRAIRDVLRTAMGVYTDDIPYSIEYVSPTQIKVNLFPIPEDCLSSGGVCLGTPVYRIPLLFNAGSENVIINAVSDTDVAPFSTTVAQVDNKPIAADGDSSYPYCMGIYNIPQVKTNELFCSYLQFTPYSLIKNNDTISIKVKNGSFSEKDIMQYNAGYITYDEVMQDILARAGEGNIGSSVWNRAVQDELSLCMGVYTDELPYKIKYVSQDQINVELAPIIAAACNNGSMVSQDIPYYFIPLNIIANGRGDVTITVSGNNVNAPIEFKAMAAESLDKPMFTYGDANNDGDLNAADSSMVLQKVLTSSFELPIESVTDDYMLVVDVDKNNELNAADSALILQKVLISSFTMPCEEN